MAKKKIGKPRKRVESYRHYLKTPHWKKMRKTVKFSERIMEVMEHWDDSCSGKYLTIYRGKLSSVATEIAELFAEYQQEIHAQMFNVALMKIIKLTQHCNTDNASNNLIDKVRRTAKEALNDHEKLNFGLNRRTNERQM